MSSGVEPYVVAGDLAGLVAGPGQIGTEALTWNAGGALDRRAVVRPDGSAPLYPLPDQTRRDAERPGCGSLTTHGRDGLLDLVHGANIAGLYAKRNSVAISPDERSPNSLARMAEPKRDRTLTDPEQVAACRAFARAWRESGHSQQEIAEQVGVTPGMVSHWVKARAAIPAIRAVKVAQAVGADPEEISADYAELKRHFSRSQPPRLDPQMMAEALVAVLKAQERDRRAFRPGHTARALCAIYELRVAHGPTMTKRDLAAFDRSVEVNINRVWGELGEQGAGEGVVSYRGDGDSQPAKTQRKPAGGRKRAA